MPVALEGLAEVFDEAGRRERLPGFVAGFGADFYGLPRPTETVTLSREDWVVPDIVDGVVPYRSGETVAWKVGG